MTKTAEKAFTSFEVAKICGVFHTTVINWVNKGKLKAHATPGGHRRVALGNLVEFMNRFEMPIPEDLTRRSRSILIVEDDPAVQRMIRRTLESLPEIELQTCASGVEALVAIGRKTPDLLVLDIRIPQVNGLEVCQVLRAGEQTKPIKIIAVSGSQLRPCEESFLAEHADAFFAKPLPTAELQAKARELLEKA